MDLFSSHPLYLLYSSLLFPYYHIEEKKKRLHDDEARKLEKRERENMKLKLLFLLIFHFHPRLFIILIMYSIKSCPSNYQCYTHTTPNFIISLNLADKLDIVSPSHSFHFDIFNFNKCLFFRERDFYFYFLKGQKTCVKL